MRGQLPGIVQPQPRPPSGFSDMQLLQQQYFNKQMQGIRQRQLQQLDQEARQQNSAGQFSPLAKQVSGDQVPTIVNGTPVHDASNYLWSTERVHQTGGDPKMLAGSQMFMFGNSNTVRAGSQALHSFPNSLVHSQDQAHAFRSMGLAAQQSMQTTHGTSFSSLREASSNHVNPYSSFQGGQENADILSRSTGNQAQKTMMQSNPFVSFHGDQSASFSGHVFPDDGFASKQTFQGRNVFGQVPHVMQNVNSGITGGNFPQTASLTRNLQMQEFYGRQENVGWMGNAEEKVPLQEGMTTLDPVEEKMLYGGDQPVWDTNRGAQPLSNTAGSVDIMSAGSFMQGNQLEGSDCFNMFPSVQSGSWSALMQSAVAEASSSDTGMQEEWSGLSLQKAELSTGNPSDLNDSGRHSAGWVDINAQSANSFPSRPLHLFDDATMNNNQSGPRFQQITPNITYEHSGKEEGDISSGPSVMGNDGAFEADRELPKEVTWLDQIPQERTRTELSVQTPLSLGNASGGAWRNHSYHQTESVPQPGNIVSDALSMQSSWTHQRQPSMITFQVDGQSGSKLRVWNMNESLPSNGEGMQDNEDTMQDPQTNESLVAMHLGRRCDGNTWQADERGVLQKNSNQSLSSIPNLSARFQQPKPSSSSPQLHNGDSCMNSFIPTPGSSISNINQVNSHHMETSNKFMPLSNRSDGVDKYQGHLHQESSLSHSNKAGETHENNREVGCYLNESSGDVSTLSHLYHGQQKTTGSIATDSTWSAANGSLSLPRSQKVTMHAVQRNSDIAGSRKFLYHPMGELAMTGHQLSTMKHDLLFQRAQHASNSADNGAANSERGFVERNMQNNGTGAEFASMKDNTHGDSSNSASSFDGRMAFSSKDRCDTSQNMLELLNKVDHSRENAGKTFVSSEYNLSPGISEASISDTAAAPLHGNQSSSLQGFGLHLAPPSGPSAVPKHFFPAQASSRANSGLNSRDIEKEDAGKGQTELHTMIPRQTLQHNSENTRQTYWNNKPVSTAIEHEVSTMTNQNTSSSLQSNHTIMDVSGIHYVRNQLQYRHMSGASGRAVGEDSVGASYGSQIGPMKLNKSTSGLRQGHQSEDQQPAELLGHMLQAEVAGKVASVDMHPHGETDSSTDSPFLARDSGLKSQILPSNVGSSYIVSSSQLVHTLDPLPVVQVSGQQGVSQQNTFSTILHNVWSNVSAQRNASGVPQMLSRGPGQSVSPATTWMFQALNDQKLSGKGGNSTSEVDPTYTDSQHLSSGDQQNKESPSQHMLSDKAILSGNAAPLDSLERERLVSYTNQKNDNGDRLQHEHSQASKLNTLSFQRTPESAASSQSSYSLLHQMQAMKSSQTAPKNAMTRFRGADDPEVSQLSVKNEQKSLYGYGSSTSDTIGTSTRTWQNVPYPVAGTKNPSLPLEEDRSQKPDFSSDTLAANTQNQDIVSLERNKSQGHPSGHLMVPTQPLVRGSVHSRPEQQMATSWFEQFGTYRNGHFVTTADRFAVVQKSTKPVGQQFFFGRVPGNTLQHATLEQRSLSGSKQIGFVTSMHNSTTTAAEQVPPVHTSWQGVSDQSQVAVKRKKRKRPLELLPWNKVVTRTSQSLQSIRVAELQWACATNRRIEKFDDEAEMIDDDLLVPGPRKRVIFTTQLMQQIISPLSAAILSAEATLEYETTIYMLAKRLLGDACGLLSSVTADLQPDTNNMISVKIGRFGRLTNQSILKLVEGFLERVRNLENGFLRLEKGPSILDTRVECQDLERFSIINRFARFHGRGGPAEVVSADGSAAASAVPSSLTSSSTAASSSSDAVALVPRKIFPQRYVTAVPMPTNLPEGLQCHSL